MDVGSAYSCSVALQDTYLTIQYTKTTQTRSTESLSKGGSEHQEEPKVEEEVKQPVEEEKAEYDGEKGTEMPDKTEEDEDEAEK